MTFGVAVAGADGNKSWFSEAVESMHNANKEICAANDAKSSAYALSSSSDYLIKN